MLENHYYSGNIEIHKALEILKSSMLKTRIIPCLDVKDGRVVKGINFVNLVDAGDPVEQAKILFEALEQMKICFLDISASLEKRKTMIEYCCSNS